jgi:hypothetical protein
VLDDIASRTVPWSTWTLPPVPTRAIPRYYGFVYPAEKQERETRVTVRLHPRWVTVDAAHRD